MSRSLRSSCLLFVLFAAIACAQEAETGITIPATITGGLMSSDYRYFGYHAAAYPAIRLNDNWYAYAAVDLYSTPFFYYPEYNGREWGKMGLEQAYVARAWKSETFGVVLKAGKLATAYGAPQREYDDMLNALLDQPLSFTSPLPLYPSLNVCPGGKGALCFNYTSSYYAYAPVSLYGVWGIEASGWWKRFDGRFQASSSSVANPQPLTSGHQHAQWAAGAGYTISPSLRVGFSGFLGAWLNGIPGAAAAGISTASNPATGVGADAEWAHGRWKSRAEWQRLTFPYPTAFQTAMPTANFASAETKLILTPRLYAAGRLGYQRVDGFGEGSPFAPNLARYEIAAGFRPNGVQLIKVGCGGTSRAERKWRRAIYLALSW